MKKDFLAPVFALAAVCFLMSLLLAAGNRLTEPVIKQAAEERAQEAQLEIIPGAKEFEPVETSGLPKSITGIYRAEPDLGFIFMISAAGGYGGEIKLICGIDTEGRIIKTKVLSHAETQGLGTIVFESAAEYEGKDKNLEGIDAIAGSTITSNAYKNGISDAFAAFEIIKEQAEPDKPEKEEGSG